jgi:hypothetical protein
MTAWDVIGSDRLVRLVGGRSVYRDAYYIGERDDENTVQLARFIPADYSSRPSGHAGGVRDREAGAQPAPSWAAAAGTSLEPKGQP